MSSRLLRLSFLLVVVIAPLHLQTQQAVSTPVVHAVMFWMDTCGHCHYVLEEVLPPLQAKYGEQLELLLIELKSTEDIDRLYQTGSALGIARENVGVPFLIIGEHVLIGSDQIPAKLPGLIETYLAQGGVDYPQLDVLSDILPTRSTYTAVICAPSTPCPEASAETTDLPVVNLLLFWTSDCHACRQLVAEVLPALTAQYGGQIAVQYVDVVTNKDVEQFYQVAAAFGVPREQAKLPLLMVGDHMLIGAEQIPAELPGLVEMYLASGGVELPDVTRLVQAASSPEPAIYAQISGFSLAIAVMLGMIAAVVYAGLYLGRGLQPGKTIHGSAPDERWRNLAIVALCLVGLGVAGYLTYVETQMVNAMCGPVGDCNAVQGSPYARLFGILPVGVLGGVGYLAILAMWGLAQSRVNRLADYASMVVFGITALGVFFSLYLTYLEPFVIKAVCMWCLSSAVIMTLLLLLSLKPAVQTIRSQKEYDQPHAKT